MAIDEMLYLENLEEFVFDEDKIVTYKWLSKSLAVHVNAAKQMLYTFVDHQRNKKDVDTLNVTYLVCGVKEDDKGNITHHVEIVAEERLNAVKSAYKQITSCHVYSVQKSKLKDSNALYIVDYELLKKQIFNSNQYSAITCKLAKPRSRDEISKLQSTSVATSKREEPSNKSTSKPTNGTTKAKAKGLEGMFAKAAEKKKKEEPVAATEKTKSPEKMEPESKGKGKMGATSFFGKSSAGKKTSEPAQEAAPAPAVVKKEAATTATIKGTKTIREESDDDDEVQQKKRRRIKAWESSSEEEDIEEPESPVPSPPRVPSPTPMEEEPEDPVTTKEPSPVKREVVEKTVPSGGGDGKRRRVRKRKLVPKRYMDDKGYMVTDKVWESDSTDASEVEEIVPPPKRKQNQPETKAGKKKTASLPKKTKQASLMSFFGKR